MRLTMSIDEALDEFKRQAPRLVATGDKAGLTELYATLTASAQNANPIEAWRVRNEMTQALRDALAEPVKNIRRGIFNTRW